MSELFTDDYFRDRDLTDAKRISSFHSEEVFIRKHIRMKGKILDFGCSTGEFLETIKWEGTRYGTELNIEAAAKASERGINMISNLAVSEENFSAIVLRGVIQHVENPFELLEIAYNKLEPGGSLIFLATPNADSLVYRLFGKLPALDPPRNFWIPRYSELLTYCDRAGFDLIASRFPYRSSPYSHWADLLKFLLALFGIRKTIDFAFHKNMMDVIFVKAARDVAS